MTARTPYGFHRLASPLPDHDEVGFFAERDVRAAVGEGIPALLRGHRQDLPHPLARLDVPGALRDDPGGRPDLLLLLVGPRFVAAGEERASLRRNRPERLRRASRLPHARGVVRRPHEDEVVVHHVPAVHTEAVRHEPVFELPRVDEYDVDVARFAKFQRFAGSDRDHVDLAATLLFERGEQHGEEAGVLRGGRRGHPEPLLSPDRKGRHDQQEGDQGRSVKSKESSHFPVPLSVVRDLRRRAQRRNFLARSAILLPI